MDEQRPRLNENSFQTVEQLYLEKTGIGKSGDDAFARKLKHGKTPNSFRYGTGIEYSRKRDLRRAPSAL